MWISAREALADSPRGPVATIARGEWKVIVVFTDAALIDRIAPDC
jgi:hypothetical protein